MATRHVIIGGGPAGINAIETIRAIDPAGEITLISDEPAYSRMVLPYYLAGNIEERAVFTGDERWFAEQAVSTVFGRRAAGVDAAAHAVRLDDGSAVPYDTLLIATGSRAVRPDIPGADGPGVLTMWTLADAQSFLRGANREAVIVGAGFIGLIILDALAKRGTRVSFVEIAPQILPRMLDRRAADLVAAHLRDRGVGLHTGVSVARIEQADGRRRLQLSDGRTLTCDVVVMATGIRPNVDFLAGSGIETDQGVLVDEHLRSSVPNVYAAGDVAQGPDLLGGRAVHAVQPTAVDHGRVAGANMAGVDVAYAGSLSMNILDALGLEACSFGRWEADGDVTVAANEPGRIYRKYVWDGDRLVGGVLVGPSAAVSGVNDVGMLKGLIQTGVALGPWKAYLEENPLDLRRPYVASGAAQALLGSTLLAGRASAGGGFRFPALPAVRRRSAHHGTLMTGISG